MIYTENKKAIDEAISEIQSGAFSCVIIKDNAIIHRDNGRGVSPLLRLCGSDEGRSIIKDSIVADKIIGKAAAMILVLSGAKYIYGELMSSAGCEYLEKNGTPYSFGKSVDNISNFKGDGICPIESSVLGIDDAQEGFDTIKLTVENLMRKS